MDVGAIPFPVFGPGSLFQPLSLQTSDYQVPARRFDVTWIEVACYSSVSDWHVAKAALNHHGIECLMGQPTEPDDLYHLLAFSGHTDRARKILSKFDAAGSERKNWNSEF
jgi:hypothetical protein